MGCSPSKGKLFSKPGLTDGDPHKALLNDSSQDSVDFRPVEEENTCLETNEKDEDQPLPTEEHPSKATAWSQLTCDTTAQNTENITEKGDNVMSQEEVRQCVQTDAIKKIEKRKKNKSKRRSTEKYRKSSIIQTKFDLQPHMVRAHQAGYDFLKLNISRYETLLHLLDSAAQTQLTLQPMMSALVLHFEEINQALEEMAEEGELMLKEHGDYMAFPSGMMSIISTKHSSDTPNSTDPPPDLLQQLLQHAIEKMKLIGGSVKALGDTTLEEVMGYISFFSKQLVEKLQAKQAVEQRLAHVVAHIEGAAIRKSYPEDSALHSEDSGIGGENESLTGSERHRRRRGSAGSGSCGSGVNIQQHSVFDSLPNNVASLIGHNKEDEEDEEKDDNDEEKDYNDDEVDRLGRKRSGSSPPDPSQPLLYMHANCKKEQQPTVKRPLTANARTHPEHTSSSRYMNIMMEQQKNQRDLDQRMKKKAEIHGNRTSVGPHYNLYRAGLRRHSISASECAQKGPLRANHLPYCLPSLPPQPPKCHSVRSLINTFSQRVDGSPEHSLANVTTHIRKLGKSRIILSSNMGDSNEGGPVINDNNNSNGWHDCRDGLDVDNLPPPPPEVLMDNSFQSTEDIPGDEEGVQGDSAQTLPTINLKAGVSQRLKVSVQNVEVQPNHVRPKSISQSLVRPVRQDAVMGAQETEQLPKSDLDPDIEKANCLHQQAHKIIHPCNAAESLDKRKNAELTGLGPLPLQDRMSQRCESNELYDGEIQSWSLPVTAPPVSRVRLPPSCPSVCHRFPSPPVCRPQSTSKLSSNPNSPRTMTRATGSHTEFFIPSVSFHDARSVFCQNDPQWSLSSRGSAVPILWGEIPRGRLPTRGMENPTRRTQSEQRPSMSSHSEYSKDGSSSSTQGSKLVSTTYRVGSPLMSEDSIQSDTSTALMTA